MILFTIVCVYVIGFYLTYKLTKYDLDLAIVWPIFFPLLAVRALFMLIGALLRLVNDKA